MVARRPTSPPTLLSPLVAALGTIVVALNVAGCLIDKVEFLETQCLKANHCVLNDDGDPECEQGYQSTGEVPSGGLVCERTCVPNHLLACYQGNVHSYDSCGVPGELHADCCHAGCEGSACSAPASQVASWCSDGDLYWYDACGNREGLHTDCCGAGCIGAACNSPNPQQSSACHEGDVWWFDACGRPTAAQQTCCAGDCADGVCPDVAQRASAACSDGNAYWYDSCGNRGDIEASCCDDSCQDGVCGITRETHATVGCFDGDLYWFDTCAVREDVAQDCCDQGCTNAVCNPPALRAGQTCFEGNVYYVDSCGAFGELKQDCCGAGCALGECMPPDQFASVGCIGNDVYWHDSCGVPASVKEPCGLRTCRGGVCVPDDCYVGARSLYLLDGAFSDSGASGNHLVDPAGSVIFANDRFDRVTAAARFDGSATTKLLTGANVGVFGNAARTISLWFRKSSHDPDPSKIDHYGFAFWGDLDTPGGRNQLRMQDDGFLLFHAHNVGDVVTPQSVLPADNAWHHFAVTHDGSTTTMYLDGISVATRTPNTLATIDTPLTVGSPSHILSWLHPFSGDLDDLGIWARAMTASEVAGLYACSAP